MPNLAVETRAQAEKFWLDAEALMKVPDDGSDIPAESQEKAGKLIAEGNRLAELAQTYRAQEQHKQALLDKWEIPEQKANGRGRQVPGSNFKDLGEFLVEVKKASLGRSIHPDLREFDSSEEGKVMTGQTGTGGDYLIPEEFSTDIQSVLAEEGIVRQRASVLPMTRRTLLVPNIEHERGSLAAGDPAQFGGLIAYWAEEAASKTASEMKFTQTTLEARKLIVYTEVSDELLDDSAVSLSALLTGVRGMAGLMSWKEDYSFLHGDGVGKPVGVVGHAGTYTQSRAGANAISYADLVEMRSHFFGNGVWLAHISTMPQLLQLSGPSGNPSYIWGSAVAGAPNTLLGFPIIFTEKMQTLGTVGDILLADWAMYWVGDRQATTVQSSIHHQFQIDATAWRAVHRVAGVPKMDSTFTLADGSTEIAPFVELAAG